MFVSPAFAQAGGAAGGLGGIEAFLPIILIFVVFYFLLIRPQQKKQKEHRLMLEAIRRGDKVVTGGGIIGAVTKVIDEKEVMVEIAENTRVRVQRSLIYGVVAKTEPVKSEAEAKPAEGGEQAKGGGSMLKKLLGGKSE